MSKPILYEKVGQVAKIWLNRPERNNAVTKEMLDLLAQYLKEASDDDEIRVIVLQGKGENFCCSYDHGDSECIIASGKDHIVPFFDRRKDTQNDVDYYFRNFFDHRKPIICGVRGDVMGCGTWFTLFSDCVIAGSDTEFHALEYAIGLNYSEPFPVQYWKLPMNIAMEYALTGYPITAQQGHMWGLYNHVVEPDKVDEACMKLASRMLRLNPYTLSIQHDIGTYAYELKGIRHIMPIAKEGINAALTITSNPGSDAYWNYSSNHTPEEHHAWFHKQMDDLRKEDDWEI